MNNDQIPIKIQSITEKTKLGPNGNLDDYYHVIWGLDGVGTFTTDIPKADFRPDTAAQYIIEHAQNILGFLGAFEPQHNQ